MSSKLSIAKIDEDIARYQNSLLHFPRSHSKNITSVYGLAMARLMRYRLSRQKEDLDKSILHYTEAILLPPASRARHSFYIVQLLFNLADFNQVEDIGYPIEYLRYLKGLPLESFEVPSKVVIEMLIKALGAQVESGVADGIRNIGEMVVLCRELLQVTSDIPADFPGAAFIYLKQAVNAEFDRGQPVPLLDEVIECLQDAVKMWPLLPVSCSHLVLFALAGTLRIRFIIAHSNDDYEEAMAVLKKLLDPNQPGGSSGSIQAQASSYAVMLALVRSNIFQNPEYTEESIFHLRAQLSSSSIDEVDRFHITESLSMLVHRLFRDYSLAESREEANSYLSQVVDLSSSHPLAKSGEYIAESKAVPETYSTTALQQRIEHLKELISNTTPGTNHHKRLLRGLADWYKAKFSRTNDISDIEESIKYSRLRLDSTHPNEPWRISPLWSLSEHTNNTNYLDESITLDYDILKLKSARAEHFNTIWRIVSSLLTRGRREDLHEAVRLMSSAVDNQYVREPDRFRLACRWYLTARTIKHPSVLTAYKNAMTLMRGSLSFSPTVSTQHTRLFKMGEECRTVPLDYASHLIELGLFEEAVETLEQGRALLWSEMRGLRTPIALLNEEDSPLAKRFTEINQELEAMTISVTPSARPETEDDGTQGRDGTDPFGRLVVRQRRLVEERDALVSQIQGRPGLEGFLKTPSFTTLRSVASRGPVIIINHCKLRSDILILFHKSLPCVIPTANDFYDRANELRNELAEARTHGLDSREYQDALSSILEGLYKLVGEPVINRLRLSGIPEQSRVWWCPTSVFCSLPLHAMGPIPSSDTPKRYFSDIYTPSYTPSLSALIESRTASPQILEKPSLLLVAQPDDSLPGVKGEIKVLRKLEERVTVMSLVSSEATPSSAVEGLRGSRLAHFACHGYSRLPNAEFAFLSCCHAAEITEESLADEGLHLTAAMQYCGFRSVVGTMWEMADTDGRDLAKNFYKSLFSSEKPGVPYYERTAEALRDATRKLREKRGISLERWVNFVHYGA
ncbi:hypothetical protein EDB84DRAFT_1435058 [Lactarius hengduanensis]|nr:hypothetical protein EDB84DRAFT_1435058 [Lactarius hengduanensis]